MTDSPRIVKPDFWVEPDRTGAVAPVHTGSGTLYAPETKERPVSVPGHQCSPPKNWVRQWSMSSSLHKEVVESVPHDSLFECECGTWWWLQCRNLSSEGRWCHQWREARSWNLRVQNRIRWAKAEAESKAICGLLRPKGGVE